MLTHHKLGEVGITVAQNLVLTKLHRSLSNAVSPTPLLKASLLIMGNGSLIFAGVSFSILPLGTINLLFALLDPSTSQST
jgi:hypothetical protein